MILKYIGSQDFAINEKGDANVDVWTNITGTNS
jgi:hypothetical protein